MYITPDRRIKPRIDCDYPAIIEGHDEEGGKYSNHATLVNLSASGLFMVAKRNIENGSKISVTVLLSSVFDVEEAPKLVTNGLVVRTEPKSNGKCGIAVKFNHYHFL
jgi:PilZ domain